MQSFEHHGELLKLFGASGFQCWGDGSEDGSKLLHGMEIVVVQWTKKPCAVVSSLEPVKKCVLVQVTAGSARENTKGFASC